MRAGKTTKPASPSRPFRAADHLQSEAEVAAYIEAMLEDGDARAVPVVLRIVAEAVGGMGALARRPEPTSSGYRLQSKARATASTSVSTCCGRLGCRGSPAANAAEFSQPRCSRKYGGNESGYAQIEIEAFPVQATTSTKDLDRADIFRPSPIETRYQLHRQGDRRPVRELDPQCVLQSAVAHAGGPRLSVRCTVPGAGCPGEIRTAAPSLPIQTSLLRPGSV